MALTSCPECKKEISDRANACPHCGYVLRDTSRKSSSGCGTVVLIIFVLFFVALVWSSFKDSSQPPQAKAKSQVKAMAYDSCLERGRAYYLEIGSYPFLSDGRRADDVVREKCGRTTGAF